MPITATQNRASAEGSMALIEALLSWLAPQRPAVELESFSSDRTHLARDRRAKVDRCNTTRKRKLRSRLRCRMPATGAHRPSLATASRHPSYAEGRKRPRVDDPLRQ